MKVSAPLQSTKVDWSRITGTPTSVPPLHASFELRPPDNTDSLTVRQRIAAYEALLCNNVDNLSHGIISGDISPEAVQHLTYNSDYVLVARTDHSVRSLAGASPHLTFSQPPNGPRCVSPLPQATFLCTPEDPLVRAQVITSLNCSIRVNPKSPGKPCVRHTYMANHHSSHTSAAAFCGPFPSPSAETTEQHNIIIGQLLKMTYEALVQAFVEIEGLLEVGARVRESLSFLQAAMSQGRHILSIHHVLLKPQGPNPPQRAYIAYAICCAPVAVPGIQAAVSVLSGDVTQEVQVKHISGVGSGMPDFIVSANANLLTHFSPGRSESVSVTIPADDDSFVLRDAIDEAIDSSIRAGLTTHMGHSLVELRQDIGQQTEVDTLHLSAIVVEGKRVVAPLNPNSKHMPNVVRDQWRTFRQVHGVPGGSSGDAKSLRDQAWSGFCVEQNNSVKTQVMYMPPTSTPEGLHDRPAAIVSLLRTFGSPIPGDSLPETMKTTCSSSRPITLSGESVPWTHCPEEAVWHCLQDAGVPPTSRTQSNRAATLVRQPTAGGKPAKQNPTSAQSYAQMAAANVAAPAAQQQQSLDGIQPPPPPPQPRHTPAPLDAVSRHEVEAMVQAAVRPAVQAALNTTMLPLLDQFRQQMDAALAQFANNVQLPGIPGQAHSGNYPPGPPVLQSVDGLQPELHAAPSPSSMADQPMEVRNESTQGHYHLSAPTHTPAGAYFQPAPVAAPLTVRHPHPVVDPARLAPAAVSAPARPAPATAPATPPLPPHPAATRAVARTQSPPSAPPLAQAHSLTPDPASLQPPTTLPSSAQHSSSPPAQPPSPDAAETAADANWPPLATVPTPSRGRKKASLRRSANQAHLPTPSSARNGDGNVPTELSVMAVMGRAGRGHQRRNLLHSAVYPPPAAPAAAAAAAAAAAVAAAAAAAAAAPAVGAGAASASSEPVVRPSSFALAQKALSSLPSTFPDSLRSALCDQDGCCLPSETAAQILLALFNAFDNSFEGDGSEVASVLGLAVAMVLGTAQPRADNFSELTDVLSSDMIKDEFIKLLIQSSVVDSDAMAAESADRMQRRMRRADRASFGDDRLVRGTSSSAVASQSRSRPPTSIELSDSSLSEEDEDEDEDEDVVEVERASQLHPKPASGSLRSATHRSDVGGAALSSKRMRSLTPVEAGEESLVPVHVDDLLQDDTRQAKMLKHAAADGETHLP